MAKYLFAYHGGRAAAGEAEQKAAMDAWGGWFGALGSAVIDGGNPLGEPSTVHSNGRVDNDGGANPVTGYSLIEAANLDEAIAKAKGCPILKSGGSVELAIAIDM